MYTAYELHERSIEQFLLILNIFVITDMFY